MIELIRDADPWMISTVLLLILLLATIHFRDYDQAWTQRREQMARLRGYELAVKQMHESETIKAESEGLLP